MTINNISAINDASAAALAPHKKSAGGADFKSVLAAAGGAPVAASKPTAAEELDAYVKMTPAQRMTASILKSLGLTQADLDAMSPAERAAVQAKIDAIMQQQMQASQQKKGGSVDISA